MSSEVYDRILCAEGHLRHYHAYQPDDIDDKDDCPICGSETVWVETVDQTNGWGAELETELEVISDFSDEIQVYRIPE